MRYVRHIEDADGSLVEILYYCCRLCYAEEPDPEARSLPGGWWPCLDSELDVPEACRVCGEPIGAGPAPSGHDEEESTYVHQVSDKLISLS